jgi:DUF4097 and DUF4098 domain-containing protein YvlB
MRKRPVRTTLLALAGLALSVAAAHAATVKETLRESHPLALGGRLDVSNVNGSVIIEAWDKAEVELIAEKQAKAGSEEEAKKQLALVKVEVTKTGDGLKIATKMPKRNYGFLDWVFGRGVNVSVRYTLRVPRKAQLDVDTVNGGLKVSGTEGKARLITVNGGIEVVRVAGSIDAETTNGGVQVTDSRGAVSALTTNGGIEVELKNVTRGSDLALSTTNGAISVRLPKNVRLSLDAATTNGRVSSAFSVGGGSTSKRRLSGDINGGGGKLRVRTTNGSIRIEEI